MDRSTMMLLSLGLLGLGVLVMANRARLTAALFPEALQERLEAKGLTDTGKPTPYVDPYYRGMFHKGWKR